MKNPKRLQTEILPKLQTGIYRSYWNLKNTIERGNDHSYNVVANLEDMYKELEDSIALAKAIEGEIVGNNDSLKKGA